MQVFNFQRESSGKRYLLIPEVMGIFTKKNLMTRKYTLSPK